MQSRGMMRGPMCRMGSRGGRGGGAHHARASHFSPFHGPPRGPFHGGPGEFMPLFRLLDDFTPFAAAPPRDADFDFFGPPQHHHHGHQHHHGRHRGASGPRFELFPWGSASRAEPFNPRFDVKETETTYELRGELPGVDPKDIEVAFTDAQTLVIKGRTKRESSTGQPPVEGAQAVENGTPATESNTAQDDAVSETGSTFSTSSYQQPTVEDEVEEGEGGTSSSTAEKPIDAPTAAAEQPAQQPTQTAQQQQQQEQQPTEHYWVTERSTGSFTRTFELPARVNQDGVTASLKNGILELSVPKDANSYSRRINVE